MMIPMFRLQLIIILIQVIDWQAMRCNLAVGLFISLLFFINHAHQGASAFRATWSSSHHRETETEQSLATAVGEVAPSYESMECEDYESIHTYKEYEIRRYNYTFWMSTIPPINNISFVDATGTGFLSLFDYIQGTTWNRPRCR